mgnify:CR=1 FL=1
MNKKIKIFKNETNIYSGNCYVNTVIFRGRIYDEFKKVGQNGIRFSLQLSNGKDPKTGEWNKPTFADCTAFGAVAKRILNEYKPKDEIWLIAKYYSKQQDGKYYKGFIVREIITEQEIQRGTRAGNSRLKYSEKCSTNARENSNFETFDDLPF